MMSNAASLLRLLAAKKKLDFKHNVPRELRVVQTVYTLKSRQSFDWTKVCLVPLRHGDMCVVCVSVSDLFKIWPRQVASRT